MSQLSNLFYSDVSVSRKTQIFRFSINDNQDTVVTVILYYLVYLDVVRVEFRTGVIPALCDVTLCHGFFFIVMARHVMLPLIFCVMINSYETLVNYQQRKKR